MTGLAEFSEARNTPTMSQELDLVQLQNQAKRDSEAYREDVMLQWRHFQTLVQLFAVQVHR
jgi:hypothetical protein